MTLFTYKFAYNEPRIGSFDTNEILDEHEVIKEIERSYPEAIDIEIIEYLETDDE